MPYRNWDVNCKIVSSCCITYMVFSVTLFHFALSLHCFLHRFIPIIFISKSHVLVSYSNSFPKGSPASITEFFATVNFSRADLSALRPTPNLEDQDISLILVSQLEPVWLGWPYQKRSLHQHSLLHELRLSSLTPGLQLRQGGDTCGRVKVVKFSNADLGVDGWIILGRISRRWDVGIWTGLGWPRTETGGGRMWVR